MKVRFSLTWSPLPVWDGRLRLLSPQSSDGSNHLIGVRDLGQHAQLRKPWNKAFQSAALIDYEDMLRDRAAQFMAHLRKLCEDEICVDFANLISLFSFVFRLSCYYHAHYIVIALILWVISRNCLVSSDCGWRLTFFTLDSAVYIPLCVMGMRTAFCLSWKEGFCKCLVVLCTSMFWQQFSLPSIVQHIPWLAPLLREASFFVNDTRTFRLFAMKQSQKRAAQLVVNRKDLFSYLVSFATQLQVERVWLYIDERCSLRQPNPTEWHLKILNRVSLHQILSLPSSQVRIPLRLHYLTSFIILSAIPSISDVSDMSLMNPLQS